MTRLPRFSVITAAFRAEETLSDTVASLAAQTYADFEHLVQDGTPGAAPPAAPPPWQRYACEPDRGMYDAISKAMARATGDYFVILNADDVLASPAVLQRLADLVARTGWQDTYQHAVAVVSTDLRRVRRRTRAVALRVSDLRRGVHPPHQGMVVRADVQRRVGDYSDAFGPSGDYHMMVRLAQQVPVERQVVDQSVLIHQRTGGQTTRGLASVLRHNRRAADALQAAGETPVPGFVLLKPVRKLLDEIVRRGPGRWPS